MSKRYAQLTQQFDLVQSLSILREIFLGQKIGRTYQKKINPQQTTKSKERKHKKAQEARAKKKKTER